MGRGWLGGIPLVASLSFEDRGAFQRRCKPARLEALAVALYDVGFSLRKAGGVLLSLGYAVSREAVMRRYRGLEAFTPRLGIGRRLEKDRTIVLSAPITY
ncbi:MAG: hypothetical protein QW057_01090 [Candidatus Bathyarchaeia archaeon]